MSTLKPTTDSATPATLDIGGKSYLVVDREAYQEAIARAAGVSLPSMPKADRKGRRPALASIDTMQARTIIVERLARGWTQQDLADAAGVNMNTISRIETGKHRPQAGTIEKIEGALKG